MAACLFPGDSTLTVAQMNAALQTLTYTAPASGVTHDVISCIAPTPTRQLTPPAWCGLTINIAVSIVSGVTSGSAAEGYSVYHPTGYTDPASGQALLLPTGYLATSGNQIVDPNNGNLPVRIFAANWSGMEFGNALNNEANPHP